MKILDPRQSLLNVKMTQWGVGHGGFHTTEIRGSSGDPEISRNYIYDCGSKAWVKSLYPQIEAYVNGLKAGRTAQIDVLYLSHFDKDHVSGLQKLSDELGDSIKIVQIVIPFLTSEQKLATIVSQDPTPIASQDSEYPPLYIDLVLRPEETLRGLFPEVAVQVLTPGETDEGTEDGGLSPDAPENLGVRRGPSGQGNSDVLWEVIAYAQPAVSANAVRFWKKVQEKKLTPQKKLDTATIQGLLTDYRKELREIAIDVLGTDGSNVSSIILYSAPARGYTSKSFITKARRFIPYYRLPDNAEYWWRCDALRFGGWLSTGDARLETARSVDGLLKGLGTARARRVTVIAAPHHGSDNNSCADLWQGFPNATFVTAHATGRVSHHPGSQVRAAVKRVNGRLFVVNDSSDDITMSSWIIP